ncbi:DMT family transporter [uncultured Jatrophihabitans sp.]|uniref:DMT family transporter n=1 Tax=uncultured Jatrophihabitans sp. TaxID=1610747 RepID=UPI0035CA6905
MSLATARTVPLVALTLAAAGWGLASCATKYALGGLGPVTLLTVALVPATIGLWTWWWLRGPRGTRPPRGRVVVLGLLEPAVAYLAITVGLAHTSAANSVVVEGLESAFVVVLAALVLGERITGRLGVALAMGLLGLGALEQVRGVTAPHPGDLLVLAGVLAAAAYTIVARGLADDVDPLLLTALQFAVATAVVLPTAAVRWSCGAEGLPTHVAPQFWGAAVAVGVVGYAGSFVLYNWAILRVEARVAAIVLNSIPAFGLLAAVAWLGEQLSVARGIGAALITLSVALFARAELRPVVPLEPTTEEVPLCL